jgi:hypothetical protein
MIQEPPVRCSVDQRAQEMQLFDRAYQLGSASLRAAGRQRGETGKTVGLAGDGCCQIIVHLARQGDAVSTRHEIGAGTAA